MDNATANPRRRPTEMVWPTSSLLVALVGWTLIQTAHAIDLTGHRQQENLTPQKCRPLLNWALPGKGTNSSSGPKLSQSIPSSFSFAIGDISLPLLATGGATSNAGPAPGATGPIQTAMKLLAAFDEQIYGDQTQAADEAEEEEEEEGPSGMNVVRFKRNRLLLASLNFTMLNVHLYQDSEPRFAIGVNIANTTLLGQFQYHGYTPAVSLIGSDYSKLAGHYRMSIDNLLLTAAANLTKRAGNEPDEPGKLRHRLASNELRMNISQLGYISIDILDANDASQPTSSYVLKMLQRVLQKTIKRTYNTFEDYIRRTLELEARRFLDCELTRFSPLLLENQRLSGKENKTTRPSGYLDELAAIIGIEMANSHLDRVSLPDFDYQRSVFGSNAHIDFHNGSLAGLANVRLTGETRVKLMEENLIVNASVGWHDLRPVYNWTLYLGNARPQSQPEAERRAGANQTSQFQELSPQQTGAGLPTKAPASGSSNGKPVARGFVAFSIKTVDFDAVISKSVRSHSHMKVDELVIRRLEAPKMDIGGLPGMNRITRAAVNFFMGRLKQRLVSSIQPALKQELERTLNRLALFN